VILGLDTKQAGYTCALLDAPITKDVYVCMPRGLEKEGKVHKLQR